MEQAGEPLGVRQVGEVAAARPTGDLNLGERTAVVLHRLVAGDEQVGNAGGAQRGQTVVEQVNELGGVRVRMSCQ